LIFFKLFFRVGYVNPKTGTYIVGLMAYLGHICGTKAVICLLKDTFSSIYMLYNFDFIHKSYEV